MLVEVQQLLRQHAAGDNLTAQVELFELSHGMRQEVDTHPKLANVRGSLEHAHAVAESVQEECGREAADTSTHNQNLHRGKLYLVQLAMDATG